MNAMVKAQWDDIADETTNLIARARRIAGRGWRRPHSKGADRLAIQVRRASEGLDGAEINPPRVINGTLDDDAAILRQIADRLEELAIESESLRNRSR